MLFLDKLFGKMIIGLALYGIIILGFMTFSFVHLQDRAFQTTAQENSEFQIVKKEKQLSAYYRHVQSLLLSIRHSSLFINYLNDPHTNKKNLENLLTLIGNSARDVMQIRFIDHTGMEKVRVDRSSVKDVVVHVVSKEKLQNKKNRYYFQETILLENESVWFSKLDLNIEQGKIEVPHKPTLRLAIPVIEEDAKKGIIIINLFMQRLLNKLGEDPYAHVYIVDKEGYFIFHPDPKYSFNRYTKVSHPIEKEFENFQTLKEQGVDYTNRLLSKSMQFPNDESLRIIMHYNTDLFVEAYDDLYYHSLRVGGLMLLLAVILAYIFMLIPKSLEYKLINTTKALKEKTALLKEANEAKQKLEENKKLMILQSRNAAMGEMISIIAHQWRQPLAVIGMNMNNLRLDLELDGLNEEEVKTTIDGVDHQLQHMSETIDDFKNFFKPDKEKESVDLNQLVKTVYNMLSTNLINHNITVTIKQSEIALTVLVYERELLHVVLNVINNAKDALLECDQLEKKIDIWFTFDEKMVKIHIQDNGPGISTENKDRVFEPYFTTKDSLNGTGLGLYMSKNIIENHMHGKIYFKDVEEGSCLLIMLPRIENR